MPFALIVGFEAQRYYVERPSGTWVEGCVCSLMGGLVRLLEEVTLGEVGSAGREQEYVEMDRTAVAPTVTTSDEWYVQIFCSVGSFASEVYPQCGV
jgi:hypothetical protein